MEAYHHSPGPGGAVAGALSQSAERAMPIKKAILQAVIDALTANDGNAMSLQAIRKFLSSEHPEVDSGARLLATVKKAVANGKLEQVKASFRLATPKAEPVTKKAAAKQKPAKKAAAKLATSKSTTKSVPIAVPSSRSANASKSKTAKEVAPPLLYDNGDDDSSLEVTSSLDSDVLSIGEVQTR